ncbi:hypothetical protein BGX20_008822 [Mortierella sp. AD010]|nr:hypothetical protein BGX20_008822 [Mortierella sp. AD010]
MSRKKWVCLRLIQMDFSIDIGHNIGGVEASEWKSSLEDESMNHVLTQIGRLTNLEEWSLGSNLDLLTLKGNRYLCKLTELKQLKMLRLKQAYSPYLMASEEADWIIENWPRLVHLVIDNREASRRAYESDIFSTETFTNTLAKRRPWIQID